MPKNHLKIQKVPSTWPITRKHTVFVTRPNPGAHTKKLSIPINIILRNILGKAKTTKEVKKILHDEEILVDGRRRNDHKYPVGLMDVFSIPKENEHYVMLINQQNTLYLEKIDKKDAQHKISKLENKKLLGKNKIQLITRGGRNIIVKKDEYKTGDSLLISIPEQEIKSVFKLETGATIFLFKGSHVGKIANVVSIKDNVLKFKLDSEEFETSKNYAIVIGKDKPAINIK